MPGGGEGMHRLVPVAFDDAGGGQRRLSPAAPRAALAPAEAALACPHLASLCPALAGLIGNSSVVSEEARDWTERVRPCASCRVAMNARRTQLAGLRLGKREREVLLGAARHEVFTVTSPGIGRSASAALRRAAQTLRRAGLLEPAIDPAHPGAAEPGTASLRAAVTLTPFGRYAMAAFGRFIERGSPVRWTRPKAGVPLPGKDPSDLVDEALALTRAELHRTLDELKRVLLAAIARPVRDPALLDAVTRRLQGKAQGLRDLLEAKRGG